ncbi:MAG: hypothetical protein ACRBBW_12560 [Cellvibrionaceae bacterium]
MAENSAVKKSVETPLKSFASLSGQDIANAALTAGCNARNEALNAGLDVRSTDKQGNTVIDRKLPNGMIQTTIQDESNSDAGEI